MRFTQALRAQHLGHMFKKHWMVQGRRTPHDSGAKAILEARNIEVVDAVDFVKPVKHYEPFKFENFKPVVQSLDASHPDWHERHCYTIDDTNVLLDGVRQAQVLTRSLCVAALPAPLQQLVAAAAVSAQSERNLRSAVLTANVFDAEQVKLDRKRKDPQRPAFTFPREYGISDNRRMRLLIAKLLAECELLVGRSVTATRQIVHDVPFAVPIERDGNLIRFGVQAETFIASKRPIRPEAGEASGQSLATSTELPNLFPLTYTISMPQTNIYKEKDHYPISTRSPFKHAHTIILHSSPFQVRNTHETPVTESQLESRSLLKAFAVAAASARAQYGVDVGDLPEPLRVQTVQTDGRQFHFGTFELNTLRLGADQTTDRHNIWYSVPALRLFEACEYRSGQPVLIDLNPQVLHYLSAFYRNN